jgi:pimeloyl-ACP methyl ester carboxylesterase
LEGEIVGKIELVGFSNGAPAMIKAAETLFKSNSPVAEKISKLVLMHPGGCFSKEDTEGIRGVATRLGLASAFAIETVKSNPLKDPNEWMLQMDDVQPRGAVPASYHIERVSQPILEESVDNIPVPIHVVLGEEDKVIPAEKVKEGLEKSANRKNLKIHLVPGAGHNFFTKHGMEYAKIIDEIDQKK